MAMWNIKDLALPPIATYKANTKDIDVFYLRQVCKDAKQFFGDKRYLHAEYLVLSRIVYRMKQKFRSSKDFKAVVKMYKTLDNYFKINMLGYIDTFMELIPCNYEDDSTYLPTKNLIDYILVRHQGLVKLLVRVVETSKLAAHLLEERIHIGHSWQSAFILFAIASRIYVLSKFIIQKACDFYQKLLPFSSKLKNLGADWLKSDYQLPKDLRQWLNVDWLDIDDEVKIIEEPELPRIIDFFDLVDDDGDEVQFCDEYIVLDESLLDIKGNKNGKNMLEDSIKKLRGFDLEDEGEIILVDNTIQNTSSNCEKIISVNDTVHPRDDVVLDDGEHDKGDDVDLSLTFGNISAIPNDSTLTEKNVDKLHSTGILQHDDLFVPLSRSDDSQNNRNVSETLLSGTRIINATLKSTKHSENTKNIHNSRAHIKTNNQVPSNSTTIDNSVEIIEKDVTIISINDTICPQDNAGTNKPESDNDDCGVELSFGNITDISDIPHDTTLTEENVDIFHDHPKNDNNGCLCLSHSKKALIDSKKNKKQKETGVQNIKIPNSNNNNLLPSNSTTMHNSVEIIEKDITIISINDTIIPQDNAGTDEPKSDNDDVGVELTFGNITAIPHDTTLTEENVNKIHAFTKNDDNDCLCLSHSKKALQNKKNKGNTQGDTPQSVSKIMRRPSETTKNKKQKGTIGTTKIKTKSNENILPSTSKIGLTAIENKKQKHTNTTPSTPMRQLSNPTDNNIKEVKLNESPKCTMKTTNNVSNISDFNVTMPTGYVVLSTDSDISFTQSSIFKSNENILPSTSKKGITAIENKKQKHTNTTRSTPMRQLSNPTDNNIKEVKLNGSPKYTMKTTNNVSNISDFNVTIPTGYVVLSSDSEDSDISFTQRSIFKQKGQEQSKFVSQEHCDDSFSQDSFYIDINRSQMINEPHQINKNYTGEPSFSLGHAPSRNKKRRKKRSTVEPDFFANSPKRVKFERDPQAGPTNYHKQTQKNNDPHFKVKSKRRKKSKRYFTMQIAE